MTLQQLEKLAINNYWIVVLAGQHYLNKICKEVASISGIRITNLDEYRLNTGETIQFVKLHNFDNYKLYPQCDKESTIRSKYPVIFIPNKLLTIDTLNTDSNDI